MLPLGFLLLVLFFFFLKNEESHKIVNKLLFALTEIHMKCYLEKLSTHFSFVVFVIQNYELVILWSDYKTVYDEHICLTSAYCN